jgi:hypothetical protein
MGDCPDISSITKAHFKELMKQQTACFKASGKSVNGDGTGLIDDLKGCEQAIIGHDFTFHTHPVGKTPSQADFQTNIKLEKRFLCIGHAPSGKTLCYDLAKQGTLTKCQY